MPTETWHKTTRILIDAGVLLAWGGLAYQVARMAAYYIH